jgi:hypothetical protein
MKIFTLILLLPAIFNIEIPSGYKRTPTSEFGKYLRNITLKTDKTVYLYNGQKKKTKKPNMQCLIYQLVIGICSSVQMLLCVCVQNGYLKPSSLTR